MPLPFLPIMMAVSAGLSAATTVMGAMQAKAAGDAQGDAFEIDADRYRIKRDLTRVESAIQARRRAAEFREAEDANIMAAVLSNLAIGSFDALRAENARRFREEATMIEQSGRLQEAEFSAAAAGSMVKASASRAEGRMAFMMGMLRAGSTLAGAAFDYEIGRREGDPSINPWGG